MDRGILVDRLKFDPINQSNFNRLPYCNYTPVCLRFAIEYEYMYVLRPSALIPLVSFRRRGRGGFWVGAGG